MDDLTIRIKAAIDETERIALAAIAKEPRLDGGRHVADDGIWAVDGEGVVGIGICIYDEGGHDEEQAHHIARHDPASVLRMVAANRKILDLHVVDEGCCAVCHGPEEMQEFYDRDAEQETVTWVSEPAPHPCPTLLALAEGYGIEA